MAGSAGVGIQMVLENLNYGTAAESEGVAKLWIEKHNKSFGQFVNGSWTSPEGRTARDVLKPSTGEKLASMLQANTEDISSITDNSQQAFRTWSALSPYARSQHLYSIARNLQKHQSLLAVMEALTTGQPTRETRGVSAPAAVRHFYHHAGWAGLMADEMAGWKPLGVVVIMVSDELPLMQMAGKVSAALAMGNTVVMVAPAGSPLSTLLLADICSQSGMPDGVVNVLCAADPLALAACDKVDKIVFSGSKQLGTQIRQACAGTGKSVSVELHGRSSSLVMEGADLDSVVEGLVDSGFFNSGQSPYSGSRLLVQEPVYTRLVEKLKTRMGKLTGGDNFDKNNDQGSLASAELYQKVKGQVERAQSQGAEVYQPYQPSSLSYPPTLVTNLQTSSQLYLEACVGPVVVALPFRTAKEGVALANHTPHGLAASVWTEDLTVALEVASLLQVTTVWVNGQHMYDAASGIGACKSSGGGRTGGKQSLYQYLRPSWQSRVTCQGEVNLKWGQGSAGADVLPGSQVQASADQGPGIDKTYKLFYGGGQKRPDSGASRPVVSADGHTVGYVPDAGKKDVRNAVEAALKAAGGWARKEAHVRAQIMYYMAENLQARRGEYTGLLAAMAGGPAAQARCEQEVDQAVQRLFYWAAYCDKYGGDIQETPFPGLTVSQHQALGVVAAVCPHDSPLLAFISLLAPAVARGNAVVMVTSQAAPIAALAFQQILETSDVPAGVVNILTGNTDTLARCLADHHDVSAVWYFGTEEGSRYIEHTAATNTKLTWVNYGSHRDFSCPQQGQGREFLTHATQVKATWLPMGTIFAN